jgi:hypothetical protein
MKPEASTLSAAILLISAGESVTEVSKMLEKELKQIGEVADHRLMAFKREYGLRE